ncbi:MAG: RNA polymerase sigma factor [Polyangiales bacterium]
MRSDEALHEALRQGDLSAFDTLYARLSGPLYGFILRHLADAHEAEDVLHDTFMALLTHAPDARSLRAWLYQCARHHCLHRLRDRRRGARALDAAAHEPPEVRALAPGDALEARETAARLARAVAALPDALAELYALRADGLSYEELSTVLGIPVGTVKSRIHDMVARLRTEMTR